MKNKRPARGSTYSSRREMLLQSGAGFGALALSSLLGQQSSGNDFLDFKVRPQGTHHRPTAKSVIFLFMEGGPSHIDLFDPKPLLKELAGQPLPASFEPVILAMGEDDAPLFPSQRKWKQHGESGLWVSDWLPHTAECVDDLCVIRSCWGNGLNHSNGLCQMNTGDILGGRPSLGSWVTYGLGTENESLPAFVVLEDHVGRTVNGPRNWSGGFMPAKYQGVALQQGDEPIPNLHTPTSIGDARHRGKLDFIAQMNQRHAISREQFTDLEARIKSYELAYRMQAEAPEAIDISQESQDTLDLYGVNDEPTATFGRNCLLARRLVERGVRFVQLYHGAGSKWDAHNNIEANHSRMCLESDKPVAGLLKDLKQRGLLEDTLVVWGGEFGRTPMSEQGDGRDHNCYGFTMWMAGGGVKGGQTIGATDEIGLHAIQDRLHIHDLHATILYLMGLHHMELVYVNKGRPERATLNEGAPCLKVLTG